MANRDFPYRAYRRLRALLRQAAGNAVLFADEPRAWRAWRRGWEASHFVRLQHWRDAGFRPQVVYDVGAHQGVWSEMCQAVLSPQDCLLFEPQRDCHAEIHRRAARGGGRWRVLPVALGDRGEKRLIHVNQQTAASSLLSPHAGAPPAFWGGSEVRCNEIEVVALDEIVAAQSLPAPDLIKIDVQGFEAKLLAGGRRTVCQAKRLIIEVSLHPIYEAQPLMPEILQTLAGWGFALEDINEALRQWPLGGLWQVDLWLKNTGLPRTTERPRA